jgi:glycosyltransferase involved in cell wall biosynthesis
VNGERKRLRVLIIAPSLDILGGQAVQAQLLLEYLKREPELDVSFLPINPRVSGLAGRLQAIKYVRTIVTTAAYIASLLRAVPNFDVIHVFSASYFSFLLAPTPAILVARLYGKKIVLNYRSGEAEDHLARWRTAVATLRLCDLIAVPSGYLVDVFARFNLQAQPIFNIVDTSRFCFRRRIPARPVFLCNRNLEPMYNVGCTLLAFAIIQQRFPDATLTVAGEGSQRRELEWLVERLRLQNVSFIGRVPHHEMDRLYDRADIYLNSSEIDNMPGSIIEAFASGLPVVTTDAGGIPYIVRNGETGFMVPRGDFRMLAGFAIRLVEDPKLVERLTYSARAECSNYEWKAVRDKWLELYREVARQGRVADQRSRRAHIELPVRSDQL